MHSRPLYGWRFPPTHGIMLGRSSPRSLDDGTSQMQSFARKTLQNLVNLIGLCLIGLVSVGCAPSPELDTLTSTPEPDSPIRIGIVTSVSGPLALFGQAHLQGYDLALEEINNAGGINGRPLRLVFEDDSSTPDMAAAAVEKLATVDQVPLIIGTYSSSATLLAAGMAERMQVPLIIPTGSADEIMRQGYRWVFRISAPSSVYTQTLLDFMQQRAPPQRLAIVFENTAYGTSVAEAAKQQARARDITIVSYYAYQASSGDFQSLLLDVKAADPDVVLFVAYLEDAVALMDQSKQVDLNPSMFAGAAAGFSLPDFPELAGDTAEYTISVSHWTPDVRWPGVADFTERFERKYGHQPQYHSAQAYAALLVAADALRHSSNLEPESVREALRTTDMNTIFGPIRFDDDGQNQHSMLVTQVIDGKFVTVYPPEEAVQEAIYPVPPWSERTPRVPEPEAEP